VTGDGGHREVNVLGQRRRVRLVASVLLVGGVLVACSDTDGDHAAGTTEATGSTTISGSAGEETNTSGPGSGGEFPEQPVGVPWPTAAWAKAPWPAGVDRAAIDAATDTAFNGGSAERVRSVVIVHGGGIVYERYSPHPDDRRDAIMPSYSMAKAVTSAMIGILVRDGRLDIDEPAAVPEWHEDPDDPRAAITVRHMLQMATGIPWDDGFLNEGSEMYEMVRSDDAAAYAAAVQATSAPGMRFDYSSGTTTLLARIIGDEVGDNPDDVRAFLDDELFDKIGMDPVNTDFDKAGTWQGAYSADTTAQDFAKLGLLFLRGGEWDGEQILPEEWVEFCRTPSPANPEYGAHWWLDPLRPGVFYAVGIRGNVITVDPAHDLVIVQLGTIAGSLPLDQTEASLDAFAETDD
jgi:CubicO group peptidase (beta-lactamase class C family)